MHVYLREEPVALVMRAVDGGGLVPEGSELVAVAFFVDGNEQPSFRSLLPPDTLTVLEEAIHEPVRLGMLAEEPEEAGEEIRAMVGISVPVRGDLEAEDLGPGQAEREPWRDPNPDAWKGEDAADEKVPRAALLAFAPLVRLERRHPENFANEMVDLLETAIAGATRPSLEARVDDVLGDL